MKKLLIFSNQTTMKQTKQKLTLEHLAPYLPYKLQVGKYFESTFFQEEMDHSVMHGMFNDRRKLPILRPLSDLTKRIGNNPNCLTYASYAGIITNDDILFYQNEDNVLQLPYKELTKLLEFHFDVFNLIPTKRAISIHDIKK